MSSSKLVLSGAAGAVAGGGDLASLYDEDDASVKGSFYFQQSAENLITSGSTLAFTFAIDIVDSGSKVVLASYGNSEFVVVEIYSLGTANDLSTMPMLPDSYVELSGLTGTPSMNTMRGMRMSENGSYVYLLVDNAQTDLYQFTLSTAYDLSTASYTRRVEAVNTEGSSSDTNPSRMHITDDGTQITIQGRQLDSLSIHTLTTAWDISTMSKSNNELDINSFLGEGNAHGLTRAETNKAIHYIVGTVEDTIDEVTFNSTTDLTSASLTGSLSGAAGTGSIPESSTSEIIIYDSDTKMAYTENRSRRVHYFGMTTAADIDTAGSIAERNDSEEYNFRNWGSDPAQSTGHIISSIRFSDGGKMYVYNATTVEIQSIDLTTDWDISSLGTSGTRLTARKDVSAAGGAVGDFMISPDGTKLFVSDFSNDDVYQASFTTAHDITSIGGFTAMAHSTTTFDNPYGLCWNDDGTKFYVADRAGIYEVALSTAYDLTSHENSGALTVKTWHTLFTDLASGDYLTPNSIFWNSDGTKLFLNHDYWNGCLTYVEASTAYDVTTLSQQSTPWDQFIERYSRGGNARTAWALKPDGTKLFRLNTMDFDTNDAYATEHRTWVKQWDVNFQVQRKVRKWLIIGTVQQVK